MQPLVYRRQVEFADTDMAGIVHFTAILRYMENAEHELLRQAGVDVRPRAGDGGLGWPRVSCACEFHAPLRFGDLAEVHLGITRIGSRSLTYSAAVYGGDRLVAIGRLTCACCQETDGALRAVVIPPAIRAALAPYRAQRATHS